MNLDLIKKHKGPIGQMIAAALLTPGEDGRPQAWPITVLHKTIQKAADREISRASVSALAYRITQGEATHFVEKIGVPDPDRKRGAKTVYGYRLKPEAMKLIPAQLHRLTLADGLYELEEILKEHPNLKKYVPVSKGGAPEAPNGKEPQALAHGITLTGFDPAALVKAITGGLEKAAEKGGPVEIRLDLHVHIHPPETA